MRVTLLCADPGVPLGGSKGCSVHLRSVSAALLRAGHEVTAMVRTAGDRRDVDPLVAAGLELWPLDLPARQRELESRFVRARPELVLERLALLAPFGAIAARARGIPHLFEANAPLDSEAVAHRGFVDRELARTEFRRGFAASAGTVAVSEAVAAWARELAPPHHPVRVVPNGVGPEFLASPPASAVERRRAELGIAPGEFVIGFFGSFKPWHDLHPLIAAVSRLPRHAAARLLLVGHGPTLPEVLIASRARGVEPVVAGVIPHADVPLHLASCDAVVVPYARDDVYFSPLKLMEAMAAGRAVVASATEPVARVLRDRENGWLVAPGDAEGTTIALGALASDPALRARLGEQARRDARGFTWDRVIGEVLEFARRVPAGSPT